MTWLGLLIAQLLLLYCKCVDSQSRQHAHIRRRMSIITAASYSSPGAFNFTVPPGIFSLTVTLSGASGGPSNTVGYSAVGGTGISVIAQFSSTPGEILQIRVGGRGTKAGAAGYNGGGASCSLNNGGSGGGATDIRRSPYTLADRLVVAGGGGGSASANNGAFPGGNGGAADGGSSSTSTGGSGNFYGGSGGTSVGGGAGGNTCPAGSLGKGADCCAAAPGGAGGGGRYGGGSGSASGGGGGSSYGINGVTSMGQAAEGDGYAQIDYELTPTANPSTPPTRNPSVSPSAFPTSQPSSQPSSQPRSHPTTQPSHQPTTQPSKQPLGVPTAQPSRQPTFQPSMQPSAQPSRQPSNQPSAQPSNQPSAQPSKLPTTQPSMHPSSQPSKQPMALPTSQPSGQPTAVPTDQPSCQPSTQPSEQPSSQPSCQPTLQPSVQPSAQPSTQPTLSPTSQPSGKPSSQPSEQPSCTPSIQPTTQPSNQPIMRPTFLPSSQPSSQPTQQPSLCPSAQPTSLPTLVPSSQPSQQPTIQPTCQPTVQPSQQPYNAPSAQPSEQPSSQPVSQPSSVPSAQPSARPSSEPSDRPSAVPSVQPSTQPSGQPSRQPYLRPTEQPSLQPSSQPSTQPSLQPQATPTSYPTITPTINKGEWGIIVQNMSSFHSVTRVQNTTWLCSERTSECTVLTDMAVVTSEFVESSRKYKFTSGSVTSVLTTTDPDSIIITNKNADTIISAISKCALGSAYLSCNTRSINNANFTDASYNTAADHIVYIGRKDSNIAALITDASLETQRGYYYTTSKATSIYFLRITSLPGYFSSYVAGTCVDPANSAKNNIIAGRIRVDNGAIGAMIIKPQTGYIRNSAELVTSLVAYGSGPDLIVAGGVDQSTGTGLHAYILRVNSVFRSFSYTLRLRYRVESRRLSTQHVWYESVSRGMVIVGSFIYLIRVVVDNTVVSASGNRTSLSVLQLDAASGDIVQQVSISAANFNIFCTAITATTVGFTISCSLAITTDPSTSASLLLLSADKKLTFSKLPAGFTRAADDIFYTESIALAASDAQMSTVSATIPTTSYQQSNVGQSSASTSTPSPTALPTVSPTRLPTMRPTAIPSNAPTHYRSSDPTGQPSRSPTSQPSVSPQPTSQPSTASPTLSHRPTKAPSAYPSLLSTVLPSANPSQMPTTLPTYPPSVRPTTMPTVSPTIAPSSTPTVSSSSLPTLIPTFASSPSPTSVTLGLFSPAPTAVNSITATNKSSGNNHNVPNFVIGVSVVAGVVAMLAVCFCYHRYQTKQKSLVLSQVVPSSSPLAPTSPTQGTETTYLKLASLNTTERRNSSVRSSSFTVSSLHSDEQSESEEFSCSDSFKSGSYKSEDSHSLSDHLIEDDNSLSEHSCDDQQELKSEGSNEGERSVDDEV